MEAGLKVGLYTSPHLYSIRERFKISGVSIGKEELGDLIFKIKEFVKKGYDLSYFEYTTAISMKWFEENGVDVAIFETGLGGRLDATNVVLPVLSVITNISLEHQSFLGNSIEKIAREKAGIIKPKVPIISGERKEEAMNVIQKAADLMSARLYALGRDFSYSFQKISPMAYSMDLSLGPRRIQGLRPGLLGRHQLENAGLAVASSLILDAKWKKIPEKALRSGVQKVVWPGRGEIIKKGFTCLLDGAHNMAGVLALRNMLKEIIPNYRHGKKVLLWANSNEGRDKDFAGLLNEISHYFQQIVITEPPGPRRPVSIEEWAKVDLGDNVILESRWENALNGICPRLRPKDLLVISGSLYLVGAARNRLKA